MALAKRRVASVTAPLLSKEELESIEMSKASKMAVTNVMSTSSRLTQHRRSSLFEIPSIAAIKASHCGSSMMSFAHEPRIDEEQIKQKTVTYENTYRMDPPRKFVPDKVNKIIEDILQDHLQEKTYDPIACSTLAKSLSQEIKNKVKDLGYTRYKFVSTVTIGEKKDQGLRHGSRCIWDVSRDNFASGSYDNSSLYAAGVLYAVYFE